MAFIPSPLLCEDDLFTKKMRGFVRGFIFRLTRLFSFNDQTRFVPIKDILYKESNFSNRNLGVRKMPRTYFTFWSCVVKTQLEVMPNTARDRLPESCCPAIGGQFEVANDPLPTFWILIASVPAIYSNFHYMTFQIQQITQRIEYQLVEKSLRNRWALRQQVYHRYYPHFPPQRQRVEMRRNDEAHTNLVVE